MDFTADEEVPGAEFFQVVDGVHPTAGGVVFVVGFLQFVDFVSFDLQHDGEAVFEADQEIGLVGVADAVEIVGDGQAQMVVAGVVVDGGTLLHDRGGLGLPIGMLDDQVDVAVLRGGHGTLGDEIHAGGGAKGTVTVQDGHDGGFARGVMMVGWFLVIGLLAVAVFIH